MNDSVITCDEIRDMDSEAKLYHQAKSYDKETKTIAATFNEKSRLLYFACVFNNYYTITDSC